MSAGMDRAGPRPEGRCGGGQACRPISRPRVLLSPPSHTPCPAVLSSRSATTSPSSSPTNSASSRSAIFFVFFWEFCVLWHFSSLLSLPHLSIDKRSTRILHVNKCVGVPAGRVQVMVEKRKGGPRARKTNEKADTDRPHATPPTKSPSALSKVEPALARRVGQCLHAPMVHEAAPVEGHLLDVGGLAQLGDVRAD